MNRKEQVEQAAKELESQDEYERENYYLSVGFIKGAEWADANPPPNPVWKVKYNPEVDNCLPEDVIQVPNSIEAKLAIAVECLEGLKRWGLLCDKSGVIDERVDEAISKINE